MSVNTTDKGLLTAENCVVVFIDPQPQMLAAVSSIDHGDLLNNMVILAKTAKIFDVPVVLSVMVAGGYAGCLSAPLQEIFPEQRPVTRTGLNAWDSVEFLTAVQATRRKNLVIAALWTEVCLVMPGLQALTDGFGVYAVEDASGSVSRTGHAAAHRRVEQAGGVTITAMQFLLELQRDWSRTGHLEAVQAVIREHGAAYGGGPGGLPSADPG
jgi:nicotinamidase-related amidase